MLQAASTPSVPRGEPPPVDRIPDAPRCTCAADQGRTKRGRTILQTCCLATTLSPSAFPPEPALKPLHVTQTQDIRRMGRPPLTQRLCAGLNLKADLNEVLLFHGTKVCMGLAFDRVYLCRAFACIDRAIGLCATAGDAELHYERRLRPKASVADDFFLRSIVHITPRFPNQQLWQHERIIWRWELFCGKYQQGTACKERGMLVCFAV